MAGISDYISALKSGGARPNRFEIIVDLPAFAGGSEEIRQTAFLVQSTTIPGSNLGVIEQSYRGRKIKLAGDRIFNEWPVTFTNDLGFDIYNAFERWQNAINGYNSNIGFQSPNDYMSTVSIYQLNNKDDRVKEIILKQAWPSVIGPIELSQESNDVIETFEITFVYSDVINGNNT